ncbi:WS/DGAT domain-containing protein [Streptomyces sp. PTM05]|uniref:diacylglycerol O-acyltransferase n=1 Tax=Streptantibioticus parmotrematis TaxID=2873249 RepID=A0ABS7QSB1_9ACTN|nr:WS/DGAT domain-containing protein [Streptantibioticus parmotrematis]MBY8886075.1 WS/DGAT domain-containing protein [Streptantibioticus parmotrematis]
MDGRAEPVRPTVMAPLDAMLWRLQRQAPHRTGIAGFAHLDGVVEREDMLAYHRDLVRRHPRLTCRATGHRRPRWQPDPAFSLDRHTTSITLSRDAPPHQLASLTAHLIGTPLPTDAPPWHAYVINQSGEGAGRAVYLFKTAHALADGLRLIELVQGRRPEPGGTASSWQPAPAPVGPRVRAELWARTALQALRAPGNGTPSSGSRHHAFFTFPKERIASAAATAGCSGNHVLLCSVARGVARLDPHGPHQVRGLTVVGDPHLPDARAGNGVTFASVTLPGADQEPRAALRATRAAVEASGGRRPPDVAALAATLAGALPTRAVSAGLDFFVGRHAFMASNVPAGRAPFTVAGRTVLQLFGVAPLFGGALMVTMVSYRDTCHFSLAADPAHVADVDELAEGVRDALSEICA